MPISLKRIEYGMNDVRVTYQSFFSMADKIARFDLEVLTRLRSRPSSNS